MSPPSAGPSRMSRGAFGTDHSKAAWVLAALAAYLLTRPYMGLYHDSLLYAVQALRHGGATALNDDLFFKYGNQSKFVLFPALQGWLIDVLGFGLAQKLLFVISGAFWTSCLCVLARTMYPLKQQWIVAVILALLLFAGYGNAALSYGEGFVTPRPFAEGFAILALTAVMRGNWLLGFCALLVSFICHPLVGLSVLALWCVLLLGLTPALLLAVIVGCLVLGVGVYLQIAPAIWILETHDPVWAELLHKYESLGFMGQWGLVWLKLHALALVGLLLGLRSGDHLIATLSKAVLIAAALCVLVSFIGADLLGNRLIASLQPWRALIWVALIGNLVMLQLLLSSKNSGVTFFLLVAAVIVNVTEHVINITPVFSSALAVLALIARLTSGSGRLARWFAALLGVAGTVVVLGVISMIAIRFDPAAPKVLVRLAVAGLVAVAVLVRGVAVPVGVALVACLIAVADFDRRPDNLRFAEESVPLPVDLVETLQNRVVYWENGLEILWLKLRQPQYYSCQQRAGTLFYRGQAIEHERRGTALAALNTHDLTHWPEGSCPAAQDSDASGPKDAATVRAVCAANPDLDWIILNEPVPNLSMQQWSVPVGASGRDVYGIDCAAMSGS